MKNRLANLPSIVWVILFPLGLVAFIGLILGFFYLLTMVEGFSSFVFIVVGLLYLFSVLKQPALQSTKTPGIMVALGICFFALMGMAVDQTGNYIYNKPLEILFCPDNTTLERKEVVSNPLPERTDVAQDFSCYNSSNQVEERILVGNIIIVRFVEYVILGYIFLYLGNLIKFIKRKNLKVNAKTYESKKS